MFSLAIFKINEAFLGKIEPSKNVQIRTMMQNESDFPLHLNGKIW